MRRFLPIFILLLIISAALYASFGDKGNDAQVIATNSQSQDVASLKAQFAQGDMAGFVFAPTLVPAQQSTFLGPDGQTLTMADFEGKVLLVNFWATWCAPCRHEMPSLNALKKSRLSEDFDVITISVDRGDGEKAEKFMDEVGADVLAVYHEPSNRMAGGYQVAAMPTSFLIDKEGRIIGKFLGATEWDSDDARTLIDWALAL